MNIDAATFAFLSAIVTGLVMVIKQPLPEAVRARFTSLIAVVTGIGVAILNQMRLGIAWSNQTCADAILCGIVVGMAGVGLWKTQKDLRTGGVDKKE